MVLAFSWNRHKSLDIIEIKIKKRMCIIWSSEVLIIKKCFDWHEPVYTCLTLFMWTLFYLK